MCFVISFARRTSGRADVIEHDGEQASTSHAVERCQEPPSTTYRALDRLTLGGSRHLRRNDSSPRRAQVCATVWRSVEREAPDNPDTDKQCRVSTPGDGTACSSAMRVDWYFQRIARRLPSSGTPRVISPLCRRAVVVDLMRAARAGSPKCLNTTTNKLPRRTQWKKCQEPVPLRG